MLRIVILVLATLASANATRVVAASPADAEITYLLGYLEHSSCTFYRNGSWYDASRARAHVETKYHYLQQRGQANTAEEFIARAASSSSFTNRPYRVKCDGIEVSSAEWLSAELQRLRKAEAALLE